MGQTQQPANMEEQQLVRDIRQRLLALQDPAYKAFIAGLLPTVDADTIIGVRTPALRTLAAQLVREGAAEPYLTIVPHDLYEENNLHASFLNAVKDPEEALPLLETFLPHVDNWATCDALNPKAFHKDPAPLLARVPQWLATPHVYTQRYAIGVLMQHYLGERFEPRFLAIAAQHRSDEYYVNMMRAWYVSMALVKQWDAAITLLEQGQLDPWTHRKAIQKGVESFQISKERKAYLKRLRDVKPT